MFVGPQQIETVWKLNVSFVINHNHHHHHHHHADIYNAPITTKQEHRCSTKIQIVVDETY